jgi:DNA-binding MarR family transcriptional regulator
VNDRDDSLRAVDSEVAHLVRRVKRMIAERAAEVHPELQGMSYLLLGWLGQNGPTRASCAVEAFKIDKGALSRHLQHMEELGLVVRTPDPDDGRASLVQLTDEGFARLNEVAAAHRKIAQDRLGDWSVAEIDALAGQLKRYNAALD